MDIRALTPASIDEATLAAWHDLDTELEIEDNPEDRTGAAHRLLDDLRHPSPEERKSRWLAFDGDRAIAYADVDVPDKDDNRHIASFWIGVRAEARRAGLATALLPLILDVAEADGRRLLQTYARQGGTGEAFLDHLGAKNCYLERCSRMYAKEMDRPLLEGWVGRAIERAEGYSLLSWDSPTPSEHLDGYAQALRAMNTAPLQDLDWEDEVFTPELMQGWEGRELACGVSKWVICARHDESGEYVGLTELFFDDPERPERCFQGNTGVDAGHRDKGLGRWLKAQNALRLLDDRPEVEWVDTWNNDGNRPMLNVNEAMGFRPHRMYTSWQVPTEDVRGRL